MPETENMMLFFENKYSRISPDGFKIEGRNLDDPRGPQSGHQGLDYIRLDFDDDPAEMEEKLNALKEIYNSGLYHDSEGINQAVAAAGLTSFRENGYIHFNN